MANNAAIASGLGQLEERVAADMQKLAYPARQWVCPRTHPSGAHVYEVAIIGGGQCGLTTSFGLIREQVNNVIVLDENPEGLEGPWATYARMVTLRTNKALTGPDLGVPSLTFQSYYEAKYGEAAWLALDKIPKEEWMAYLVWYRRVLSLPVRNTTKVDVIVPEPETGLLRLQLLDTKTGAKSEIITRKVVLATGIQGGGEWHVPAFIKESVPRALYAHTSEAIDFEALKGKRVAILGGGASAFDNAQFGLEREVGEVHVFVRRPELPRINPIRFMEFSAFLRHFSDLDDATKYAGIDFFLQFNQPPTNDTFNRACKFPNFHLHTGAPWEKLEAVGDQVRIHTPSGPVEGLFDFLIVSTGLMTDCNLRPELRYFAGDIATWQDKFRAPEGQHRNFLIDCHPYLGPSFEFLEKVPGEAPHLRNIFAFNYSALASLGLSASALSGMKYAMPKLIGGITRQLFLDDQSTIIGNFLSYNVEEFVGQWPQPATANGAEAGAAPCGTRANGAAASGSAAPIGSAPAAKLLRTA